MSENDNVAETQHQESFGVGGGTDARGAGSGPLDDDVTSSESRKEVKLSPATGRAVAEDLSLGMDHKTDTPNEEPATTATVIRDPLTTAQTETPSADADDTARNTDAPPSAVPTPTPPTPAVVPQTPQVQLTFLLISGRRRMMSFEPCTTVGRVKELVWNAWPSDWQDERPPAPSYLRILYLGKILQDEDTLSQLGFPTYTPGTTPNTPPSTIVHLSIRLHAPPTEDTPKKKKSRRQAAASAVETLDGDAEVTQGRRRRGGCGCVIC